MQTRKKKVKLECQTTWSYLYKIIRNIYVHIFWEQEKHWFVVSLIYEFVGWFFFNFFFIFLEKGEGREEESEKERERNIDVWEKHQWVASCTPPTSEPGPQPNRNLCSEWELNQLFFGSQADAKPTEPHQAGPLVDSCMWPDGPRMEPITLVCQDDALTHLATWPGLRNIYLKKYTVT